MRSRADSPSAAYLWAQAVFDVFDRPQPEALAAELRMDIQACHPGSHAASVAEAFASGLDPEVGFELVRILRLEHAEDTETEAFVRLAHLVRALRGSQPAAVETGIAILRLDRDAIRELGRETDRRKQVNTAIGWILLGVRDLGEDSLAASDDWPAVARELGTDFVKPLSEGERLITRRALVERIEREGLDKVAAEVRAACRTAATRSVTDTARANRERAEKALAGELHEGVDSEELWLHAALAPLPPALDDLIKLIKSFAGFVRDAFPDSAAVEHADAALRTVTFFVRGGSACALVLAARDALAGIKIPDHIRMLGVLICARLGDAQSQAELARELVRISRHVGTKGHDDQALKRRMHLVAHGWLVLSADPSAATAGTADIGGAAGEIGYAVISMFETNALDRLDEARRRTAERKATEPETMIVLRSVAAAPKSHGRGAASSANDYGDFDGLILKPLPLVRVPNLVAVKTELASEFPHASDLIETVLGDLVGRKSIRLRPTLLLGPPGGGKSRLARRMCEALSLPHLLYPAAGIGDAAFAGTARRWSSAEPSLPLRLLRDREVANPALIIDELEKAGSSARNGRLWDALIPMLERETASRWEDPYVQSPVDLSAVNWLATANSLEGLPSPLLDRMRILRMPSPTVEHLPMLAAGLLRELARERGLDARWLAPLAAFEIEGLRDAWRSGSIRGLRRLLEGVLEARDLSAPKN